MPDEPVQPEDPEAIAVPDSFEGLADDDLRELHTRLEERFTADRPNATTAADAARLRSYRDAQRRIAEEVGRRQAEAAQVAQDLNELDEAVALPEAEQPSETPMEQTVEDEPTPAAPAGQVPQPVAASAADIAAARTPQSTQTLQPTPARTRPRAAMVAAAGQTLVQQGVEVDFEQIGRMVEAVKGLKPSGREVVKAYVASLPAWEEMQGLGVELLSNGNSVQHNDRLIREAVEAHNARRAQRMGLPAPQTAAICDPLDIIREVPNYTSDADPFGDSLPSRPAGRLGFTYTPAIALSALSDGVQAGWDDTDQDAVDPDDASTWKPCVDIECPSPCDIRAVAVSACFGFPVTLEMSNPERVADVMRKLSALRVRNRTIMLLGLADDLSVQYTDTGDYGAWSAAVRGINNILARATYGERLERNDYTLYLPPGLAELVATDIHGKAYQNAEDADFGVQDVLARFRATFGTEVVSLRDELTDPFGAFPAVDTPTALPDEPDLWTFRLIHTPSALYFSTGEQNTGIQSDPQLARQNRRQWFSEEFVGLAKHGAPHWFNYTVDLCPSGARAGLATPFTCA